jgi:hypothetical protein
MTRNLFEEIPEDCWLIIGQYTTFETMRILQILEKNSEYSGFRPLIKTMDLVVNHWKDSYVCRERALKIYEAHGNSCVAYLEISAICDVNINELFDIVMFSSIPSGHLVKRKNIAKLCNFEEIKFLCLI